MRRFTEDEAPNVVTEVEFRELIREGYAAEIVCEEDCDRRNNTWHGLWTMHALHPFSSVAKPLVKYPRAMRDPLEQKLFRTVNGLVSFMEGCGFRSVHIPLKKGERTELSLDGRDCSGRHGGPASQD